MPMITRTRMNGMKAASSRTRANASVAGQKKNNCLLSTKLQTRSIPLLWTRLTLGLVTSLKMNRKNVHFMWATRRVAFPAGVGYFPNLFALVEQVEWYLELEYQIRRYSYLSLP